MRIRFFGCQSAMTHTRDVRSSLGSRGTRRRSMFAELALKRDLGKPLTKTERRRMSERLAVQQSDLIEEISEAAGRIAAARNMIGEPVYRSDPVWCFLKTVERAAYCC